MKVSECMSSRPVCVSPAETVNIAARLMARHNVGMLPVRTQDGVAVGILTDRDIVLRCIAAERDPTSVRVREIMSRRVTGISPQADAAQAGALMASRQIRRLPVLDGGRLVGTVTVGDLLRREESSLEAAECLEEIFKNVRVFSDEAL